MIPKRTALFLLLATAASSAMAQSTITPPESATPQQSASPFDTNPACRERTANSNSPECMLQQSGEPRQSYPPPVKVTPNPPPTQPPTGTTTPASPPMKVPGQNTGSGLR